MKTENHYTIGDRNLRVSSEANLDVAIHDDCKDWFFLCVYQGEGFAIAS
jgi:hypothetical protein